MSRLTFTKGWEVVNCIQRLLAAISFGAIAILSNSVYAQSVYAGGSCGGYAGAGYAGYIGFGEGCGGSEVSYSSAVSSSGSGSISWPGDEYQGPSAASGSFAATADFGHLGVRVEGGASASSGLFSAFRASAGGSYGQAGFYDTLQISGAETGQEVILQYSVPVHGSFTGSYDPDAGGSVTGLFTVGYSFGEVVGCLDSNGSSSNVCHDTLVGDSLTGTFKAIAGNPINIWTGISVSASAIAGGKLSDERWPIADGTSASIVGAFDHTVLTYITPLDPGVTLAAASGHNYAIPAPIPEPETYALMMAGLGVLGAVARRKKHSNRSMRIDLINITES